jgi:hypothetical protein
MAGKQERVAVLVRLPIDAKKWIARRALRNEASLNAEIVRMIRLQMEAESSGMMSSRATNPGGMAAPTSGSPSDFAAAREAAAALRPSGVKWNRHPTPSS